LDEIRRRTTAERRALPPPTSPLRQPPPDTNAWDSHFVKGLQEKARNVRQGFMDPKQKAAFEEFLARQASLGEQ
jgi:hypothetical protein